MARVDLQYEFDVPDLFRDFARVPRTSAFLADVSCLAVSRCHVKRGRQKADCEEVPARCPTHAHSSHGPSLFNVVGRPSRRVASRRAAPRVIRRADSAHREAIARAGRGGGQREGGRLAILDETCRFGVNVNGPVFTVRWMPAPAPSNHDNTVRDRSRPLSIERQRSEVIAVVDPPLETRGRTSPRVVVVARRGTCAPHDESR